MMNRLIIAFAFSVIMFGCNKVETVAPIDFNVTTTSLTYSISDSVVFEFTGNPDLLTFYSGENGNQYEFIQRTNAIQDSTILRFSTQGTNPTANSQNNNANNISLLVSTDYSGVPDSANITAATWTDISSRAVFSDNATTLASGSIDIKDLQTTPGKPLYLAFRYRSDSVKTTALARKWVINGLSLKSFFADTTVAYANAIQTAGFYGVSVLNGANNWIYANANLTFNAPAQGSTPNDDWMISRPIDITAIPPDAGVKLKNTSYRVGQFKYLFSKPGTYNVAFVAANVNEADYRTIVRQLTLVITP